LNSPHKVSDRFPDWLAKPQPDWPAITESTGFPLIGKGALPEDKLPSDLEEFLTQGTPPILFTTGIPNQRFAFFFENAVQATTAIVAWAIFITKFGLRPPDTLPPRFH